MNQLSYISLKTKTIFVLDNNTGHYLLLTCMILSQWCFFRFFNTSIFFFFTSIIILKMVFNKLTAFQKTSAEKHLLFIFFISLILQQIIILFLNSTLCHHYCYIKRIFIDYKLFAELFNLFFRVKLMN